MDIDDNTKANSDQVDTTENEVNHPDGKDAKVDATDINLAFVDDYDNIDNNFRKDDDYLDMVYEADGSFDDTTDPSNPTNPYDDYRKDNYQDATTNNVVDKN